MRVLLVASALDPEFGGLPEAVEHLGVALADAGHFVTLAGQTGSSVERNPAALPRHSRLQLHHVRRPWSLAGQAQAANDLFCLVKEWRLCSRDGSEPIVHLHGVWSPGIMAAMEAALSSRSRVVISPHGMLMREAMRKSATLKKLAWSGCVRRQVCMADAIHVTSRQEGADVATLLPRVQSTRIPWGITPASLPKRRSDQKSKRIASFLGRMIPLKGIDLLIDAWAILDPGGWELNLVGPCDPRTRQGLMRRIRSHGMEDRIRLLPPILRAERRSFWNQSDLLVLPSRSENFGLVAGEALAAAVPVVTTTATAWTEVERVGCGWCVAPALASLVEGLRNATSQPSSTLASMGTNGRRWIEEEFNWSRIADRVVRELYSSM